MYSYIKGIITETTKNYVVIENSDIGYLVYVANPYSFEMGVETTIYLYNHIREEEYSLYGFKSIEEKDLFIRLLNVKGIGPKMGLPMLATGTITGIVDAIERENILYLTKFPKIGEKLARQIILDLKGKLTRVEGSLPNSQDDLVNVLESLGYKLTDIKKILPQVDESLTIEIQIKEALKLLLK